mmetsp:Transcript_11384/g.25999  ORF Transcript_11384/g.25999 Transcript_11384/m.25999 type:complete len:119 (-) Transcript_11384:2367-2723(-)
MARKENGLTTMESVHTMSTFSEKTEATSNASCTGAKTRTILSADQDTEVARPIEEKMKQDKTKVRDCKPSAAQTALVGTEPLQMIGEDVLRLVEVKFHGIQSETITGADPTSTNRRAI